MASFSGATFLERSSGDGYPTWNKSTTLIVRQRADNESTLADAGMDVQRVTVAAQCTAAELGALYDVVGDSGSLVMDWETHTAYLEGISGVQQMGIGNDLYTAALSFIRL